MKRSNKFQQMKRGLQALARAREEALNRQVREIWEKAFKKKEKK